MTVADLNEDGILHILNSHFRTTWPEGHIGPGDDAAVIVPDGRYVICADVMNEGRHFLTEWPLGHLDDGYSTGWKLVAQNLSDVSAMNAEPTTLTLTLSMPAETTQSWVSQFAAGMMAAIKHLGANHCRVAGGDLSSAHALSASLTATGDLQGRTPVLRKIPQNLEPEFDTEFALIHTGNIGASAAGLAVAQRETLPADQWRLAVQALKLFLRPRPPLGATRGLNLLAGMDVSDGLAKDAQRLGKANNRSVDLDTGAIRELAATWQPLAEELGADAQAWVRAGGEDYGLIGVVPVTEPIPTGWRRVGSLGRPGTWAAPASDADPAGWDHFGTSTGSAN